MGTDGGGKVADVTYVSSAGVCWCSDLSQVLLVSYHQDEGHIISEKKKGQTIILCSS